MKVINAKRSGGNVESATITLEDNSGVEHQIELSPEAHTQLISALLTTIPAQPSQSQRSMRPLVVLGFQKITLANGMECLEFFVGPSASIQLAFPAGSLREFAARLSSPPPPEKAH